MKTKFVCEKCQMEFDSSRDCWNHEIKCGKNIEEYNRRVKLSSERKNREITEEYLTMDDLYSIGHALNMSSY